MKVRSKPRLKLLGDVVRFGNGKSIKPGTEGRYAVYGSNGIIGGSDEFRHENGVIIGRVGAYCGAVVYCPDRFWASDNTLVAYPLTDQIDTRFLYYLLLEAKLGQHAGGAAQPLVTQTVLKQVEVSVPDPQLRQPVRATDPILAEFHILLQQSQFEKRHPRHQPAQRRLELRLQFTLVQFFCRFQHAVKVVDSVKSCKHSISVIRPVSAASEMAIYSEIRKSAAVWNSLLSSSSIQNPKSIIQNSNLLHRSLNRPCHS